MRRRAFTLIELLVSIAILSILVAITFSIVGGVKATASQATCASNVSQIAKAITLYMDANDGRIGYDSRKWFVQSIEGLRCPLLDPLDMTEVPNPDPDFGGYAFNSCLYKTLEFESSRMLLVTEAARFRSSDPYFLGYFQPAGLAGPDMYAAPGDPHEYKEPVGGYGAVRHKGGSMYAMVDGHVKWLKPTQLRLPLQGYGCQQGSRTQLRWKGPETAPYFSVEYESK